MQVYPQSKTLLIPNYVSTLHFGASWQFHDDSNLDIDAVVMTFNKRGVHLETIEGLGRTKSVCGAIHHFGDSVTGGESGDAETIAVTVANLDPRTSCLVVVLLLPRGTFLTAGVDSLRSRVLVGSVIGDEDGDGLDDDTARAREYHLGDEMIVFRRETGAPPAPEDDNVDYLHLPPDDRDNNMVVLNRLYRNPDDKRRWLCDTVGALSLAGSQREAVPLTQYSLIELYPKIKIPGRDTGINTVKDLMNKMDVRVINKLEREFSSGGLSVHEFIRCMLTHVDHIFQTEPPSKEEELRVVALIRELFSLIDVDGDGTMDWEELTAYVVQSGLMATGEHGTDEVDPEAMEMIFVRDCFDDPTKHGKGVMSVQYCGRPLKNILVFDEFSSFVRLYDQHCKLTYRLDLPKPTGLHKPSRLTILATCYIADESIIVVSASDFILYLWDMNRGLLGRKKPKIIKTLTAPTSQISLVYNNLTKTLYSASVNQEILCWDINKRALKATLRGHKDMIVALCEIPELNLLASASMDDTINLYGMSELKLWGTCLGHKKGVRRLKYGHGLLFSCGFEFVILCWLLDVDETGNKSASGEIEVVLTGHEVMLLDIDIVPCAGARIVSGDISGRFILWDVGSNARFSGDGIILQEFNAGYGFTDTIRSFFVSTECISGPPIGDGNSGSSNNDDGGDGDPDNTNSSTTICTLIAGANDIIRFCLVHTHTKKVDVPSNVLFNSNTLQFFTQAGNDIHIWDASDGRHVHSFWNIFEKSGRAENIECMCFDTRRRKIIAGSEGGHLFVFNSVSGASMKGIKAHHGPVVSVHYADECRSIISTGTDRRICVHDESGDNLVLLRSVGSIHARGECVWRYCTLMHSLSSFFFSFLFSYSLLVFSVYIFCLGIECCAFSEELSQIATGSIGGSLRVIDYDKLRLTSDNVGHRGNITSIEFAPNHRPVLISSDTDGIICIWKIELDQRAPGSNGIHVPLLSFTLYNESMKESVRTCITALSVCSLPAIEPEAARNSIVTIQEGENKEGHNSAAAAVTIAKNGYDVNSGYNDKKSTMRSEILVIADEKGFLNEISLAEVWEKVHLSNQANESNTVDLSCLDSMECDHWPSNQPEYNAKLRYDEYQYHDTSTSKEIRMSFSNNNTAEKEEEKEERQIGKITPVRRWQAHSKSIVTVVLTSTPPLILSGSEDEKVHVWSLRRLDDHNQSWKHKKETTTQVPQEETLKKEQKNNEKILEEDDALLEEETQEEEFFGELSHHGTSSDDVFDEWHLPLDGLDLTSQHNKAAEELLAQAEEKRKLHLLREEENLKRTLELNQLKTKFEKDGLLEKRIQSTEIINAHNIRKARLPEQYDRIQNAIDQVNDDLLPDIPTWQDYFQTIAEDESEKAFSDASLIRGSLQGMFGGEELQRLRMIRKRGMHHIYSFFPPAISGGEDPMPIDPTSTNGIQRKATPAVYLHFRKENDRRKTGSDEAENKKQKDMEK